MKYAVLFIAYTMIFTSSAQVSPKDEKRIEKILGDEIRQLRPLNSYPYSDECLSCAIDESTTLYQDTTGIHLNGEYLLFRSPLHYKVDSELKKYLRQSYVTVGEFEEFQHYVRDSIARLKIYFGLEGQEDAMNFIRYTDLYVNDDGHSMQFDPSSRYLNKEIFGLNWKRSFYYTDPEIVPILADMYLPQHDRFYSARDFDRRKWMYNYASVYELKSKDIDSQLDGRSYIRMCYERKAIVTQSVNVWNDDFVWARQARDNNDEFGVLGQTYSKVLRTSPIVGLLGSQTAAYCHWKGEQLQKEFAKKGLQYMVSVSLPQQGDIDLTKHPEYEIQARDYTTQWRITNTEYDDFIYAVEDSIIREYIYQNHPDQDVASNYVDYFDLYFDEGRLEYVEYDQADRIRTREIFSLNYDKRIDWKDPIISRLVREAEAKFRDNPVFVYYQYLTKAKSFLGKFVIKDKEEGDTYTEMKLDYPRDAALDVYGYSLNLDRRNSLDHGSGVRSHTDLSAFIKKMKVPTERIYSHEIQPSNPDDLAQDISYEQALAFYHWKYPIYKIDEGDDWQDYVLPSEEQFIIIQSGEPIFVDAYRVDYPTPLFRYVVHIYPR